LLSKAKKRIESEPVNGPTDAEIKSFAKVGLVKSGEYAPNGQPIWGFGTEQLGKMYNNGSQNPDIETPQISDADTTATS
jgi:hypothetical protein